MADLLLNWNVSAFLLFDFVWNPVRKIKEFRRTEYTFYIEVNIVSRISLILFNKISSENKFIAFKCALKKKIFFLDVDHF